MARRSRNYKIVNAGTDTGTSAGNQVNILKIKKVDAQGVPNAWIKNVQVTAMVNEAEQDVAGVMFYLTTNDSWDDDHVITARGVPGPGGSVSLSANRSIKTNETDALSETSGFGPIYVWVEIGDYVALENFRWVTEVWGQRHIVEEI